MELSTEPSRFGRTSVTVRNTSNEAKLVTLAIVDSGGSELQSLPVRVDSKDIFQRDLIGVQDGASIEMIECE